jgi:EAL domain-containing protein (putative c-di-GMP-specific phosphodiesterase class I)
VVLVEAAAALRAAKAGGRNRVEVYPGRVARERERRLVVESRLREALAAGLITTVGQPVVDLRTGAAVAYEALARWEDAQLGPVPPEEFVAVAEETGLVAELGRQVLRSAVEGFAGSGLVGSGVLLAVNVSPVELRLPYHADAVAAILQSAGFPPWDLVVEVTEAVVIRAGDPAVRALAELSDLGVRVAIDDFGTGYSALGYLRRLPVQVLKVDRSLLAEALLSERTRQILAGVVDLAHRLRLPVVVEGIEDESGARLARELGADRGQGFWLGPPAPWGAEPADPAARPRPGPAWRRSRPGSGRVGSGQAARTSG